LPPNWWSASYRWAWFKTPGWSGTRLPQGLSCFCH